ncbi:TrmB family transcriptional regulator [Candidatus Pacearchaeota archaeon]|nr:TrmB family transcriptional regulator [Candidatus Pacearchaeota archaeon]
MIVKQELVNRIKDYFGLNIYETKVWLALLKKGIASAGEVAESSGIPRSRTYDVLESLEKMGFAMAKLDKPVKYIGVKPRIILEKLKNNVKKEASERIVELSRVKNSDEYTKLEELYNEGMSPMKKEELSLALKGKMNISNHIKELILNAKEEVIICTNADELASKFKLFKQTLDILKKSNVKVSIALSGDEKMIKQLSEKLNVKIKKINLNSKFFIVDGKEMLFYISKNSDEDSAIWLNSEFFSKSFAELFEKAVRN